MIDEIEYPETLRGSISLLYSMLNEYFPVFNEITPANKVRIQVLYGIKTIQFQVLVVKTIFHEMQLIYQGMQSSHYFSDTEDKLYAFYGYYISRDLDNFFKEPQKRIPSKDLFNPMMEIMFQLVKKMKFIKLNEFDVAVLNGIIYSQASKLLYYLHVLY